MSLDTILTSSVDEEGLCKDWWSINCCWDGKGSLRAVGVGELFRNLLLSSWWGDSLMKWSPPHIKKEYFAFIFPLESTSEFCGLLLSYWLSGFFDLFFPFLFSLKDSMDWTAFTSTEAIGEEVFLEGGIVGEGVWFWFLEDFSFVCAWTEPSMPSTGG